MPRGKSNKRGRGKGNNRGKRRRLEEKKDEENLPSVSVALDTEMNNEGKDGTGTEKFVVEEGKSEMDQVLEAVRKYNGQVKPVLEEFEKMKKSALKHVPIYYFPPDDDNEDDTGTSADETAEDDESAFLNMVKATLRTSTK